MCRLSGAWSPVPPVPPPDHAADLRDADAGHRGRPTIWEVRMRATRRGILALGLAAAGATVTACSKGANNNAGGGGGDKKVEVFTWWTGPGEQEGLDALVADFKQKNDGVALINAAVAGGSGSTAKSVLANRLQTGNAPDSYQRHAGKELVDDIKAGFVDDLTYLYDREGWKKTFP